MTIVLDNNTKHSREVVILGAGVIGLSIADVLSADPSNKVTIVARDIPMHFDSQGWASPWVGSNWSSIENFNKRIQDWEITTFHKLWDMSTSGLVMQLHSRVIHDDATALERVWWKDIVRDLRVISPTELPLGKKLGLTFDTISVKPARYLLWLKSELLSRGVQFVGRVVQSIEEVAEIGGKDSIVINASGLGSRSLLGVEDLKVFPIRGQTTLVQAPHVKVCISDVSYHPTGETTFIIPRPDGSVVLGGKFEYDNWSKSVDHKVAHAIYDRCTTLVPQLLPSHGAVVLSHNVYLRPGRHGGPRVEAETIQLPLKSENTRPERSLKVIHAYGFGPASYQCSWGVAQEVASILRSISTQA